ncbi:MAG: hypothetical protein J0H55_10585 [Chitinophagaceae bacterium]|nr:hypothetical protein [Chitinophagaceae bacterium]
MSLHIYLERLRYIDDLIRRKATGDLKQLSKKLNLSRSQTYNILKEMKSEGCLIKYSKRDNSYYYSEMNNLYEVLFKQQRDVSNNILSDEEMRRITGGELFFNFFQSPIILDSSI